MKYELKVNLSGFRNMHPKSSLQWILRYMCKISNLLIFVGECRYLSNWNILINTSGQPVLRTKISPRHRDLMVLQFCACLWSPTSDWERGVTVVVLQDVDCNSWIVLQILDCSHSNLAEHIPEFLETLHLSNCRILNRMIEAYNIYKWHVSWIIKRIAGMICSSW